MHTDPADADGVRTAADLPTWHSGPHSRSGRDAALMFDAMQRRDARDRASLPPGMGDSLPGLDDGSRGLRIASSPTPGCAKNVHPEVAASVAAAAADLPALGAHVEPVGPGFDEPPEIITGLWVAGAWALWNAPTLAGPACSARAFETLHPIARAPLPA